MSLSNFKNSLSYHPILSHFFYSLQTFPLHVSPKHINEASNIFFVRKKNICWEINMLNNFFGDNTLFCSFSIYSLSERASLPSMLKSHCNKRSPHVLLNCCL